jgi:hypothetical protein
MSFVGNKYERGKKKEENVQESGVKTKAKGEIEIKKLK